MNDKQMAAYKKKINRMIVASQEDWMVATDGGRRSQHSANLNGRIKALELSLKVFDGVMADG